LAYLISCIFLETVSFKFATLCCVNSDVIMFFYIAVLVKLSDFKLTSLCFLSGKPEPLIEPHIETRAEQQARKQAKLEAVNLDLMSPQGTSSAEGADLVVLS
jgi:hypothetical protein